MSDALNEAYQILNAKGFIPMRCTMNNKLIGVEVYCPALKIHGTTWAILSHLSHLGPNIKIDNNSNTELIYITEKIKDAKS